MKAWLIAIRMRIEDALLAFAQKRCPHPPHMVASDILEGVGDVPVSYCNRCGGVRMYKQWRRPDPNLWRGL